MSLADEEWAQITIWAMHAVFLRGEWDKHNLSAHANRALVDTPDLERVEENLLRMRFLYIAGGRRLLLGEVPPDTRWYRVEMLRHAHLRELRVIGRCGWDDPRHDRNELEKVADRRVIELRAPPPEWDPPILWGHDRAGPFTILEGNNRLTAYVGSNEAGLEILTIIGLSAHPCIWHLEDRNAMKLLHDLWRVS